MSPGAGATGTLLGPEDASGTGLAPAYAFEGEERRVVRKTAALRKKFGQSEAIRLGAVTGQETADACLAMGFEANRLIVVDARAWKKEDYKPVLAYLKSPTPGTVLAIWCNKVPVELDRLVGKTFAFEEVKKANLMWPLTDAWGENRRGRALDLLVQALAQGDNPYMILAVIVSHVRMVLLVRGYTDAGYPQSEIAQVTGKHPYVIKKAHLHGRKREPRRIAECLLILAECDDRIKGGSRRTPVEFELVTAVARLFG